MTIVLLCGLLMVLFTSFLHYEVLGWLHQRLPSLRMPPRLKVLLVILVAFAAHALEIAAYGGAYYGIDQWLEPGALHGHVPLGFFGCLYFSAETFTSLGFGDITPIGPVRLLAGVEALNGLLLIAWTASFTYLSMERFWVQAADRRRAQP